jgi:Protein of unknown function (DUF3306)
METTMTEEDFVKRWSRRKREVAEAEKPAAPKIESSAIANAGEDNVAAQGGTAKSEPEFDPATLPPLESINAVTDITAFLRAGVPADLTRAALRRVWTADPAIRDFVGLAENAWDFTDPNAMPGFGPLEATEDVRRMIAQVVEQIGQITRTEPEDAAVAQTQASENGKASNRIRPSDEPADAAPPTPSASDELSASPAQIASSQVSLQSSKEDVAPQRDVTEVSDRAEQSPRRSHGGALPQ